MRIQGYLADSQGQEHSWTSGKMETGHGKPLGTKGWSGHSQSCPGTAGSPVTHFSVCAVTSLLSLSDCLSHLLRVPNCSHPHKSSNLPTYTSCALPCCFQENGDVVTWGGRVPSLDHPSFSGENMQVPDLIIFSGLSPKEPTPNPAAGSAGLRTPHFLKKHAVSSQRELCRSVWEGRWGSEPIVFLFAALRVRHNG